MYKHPNISTLYYVNTLISLFNYSLHTGASLTVVVGLDQNIAIVISTAVAVLYTLIGGLYSVSLTDVIQLFCIYVGLVMNAYH